jgi:hypothetical protein
MPSDVLGKFRMGAENVFTGLAWIRGARLLPPHGSEAGIGNLLWQPPRPLIHPKARLLVIYAAKSACTQVAIWFYHHLGQLAAARAFHVWPHDYRDHVYLYSELYREAYRQDFSQFTVLKIVRDPYERAVSSFRHMLGFGGNELRKRLRFRNIGSRGLSFAAFLDMLERTDLAGCNIHYCIQRHPIEDVLPVHHLIDVSKEDLFKRLNEVEAAVGLPHTDIRAVAADWFDELKWHRRPDPELPGGEELYTRPLTREQALQGPWPRYGELLTPEARQRIARLYAVDLRPSA